MKNPNTQKQVPNNASVKRPVNLQVKVAKPRPAASDASVQGPRDCFPLG